MFSNNWINVVYLDVIFEVSNVIERTNIFRKYDKGKSLELIWLPSRNSWDWLTELNLYAAKVVNGLLYCKLVVEDLGIFIDRSTNYALYTLVVVCRILDWLIIFYIDI